ncbi:hypothetical protein [Sulfobacillus sp. hq2]|uniref:hypothetical protein n=1 Tax=Sulfobacillus TaxID=28033 RepID=UPI000CD2505A|nr:hypothetical protein [Sulfobacillus sp. hq2]POB09884.1 hypothetical protein CO251_13390 [Sulfobacillus sp. hq2]
MQPIYYGWDAAKEHDQEVGHQLFDRHATTKRTVEKLADGIRTLTTSTDPVTVALLHDHVLAMEERMRKGLVMRRWDPFFPELFRYADEINQRVEPRPEGILVEAHSRNPYVVQLLYRHAEAVTDFAKRGWEAAREPHQLPPKPTSSLSTPLSQDAPMPTNRRSADDSRPLLNDQSQSPSAVYPQQCRGQGGHRRGRHGPSNVWR